LTDDETKDLRLEIPSHAWISLARRGMERISLDQCFLIGCDNADVNLLEPFKKEEQDDEQKNVKRIHIKCKKCNGIFQLELITLKKVAKPTRREEGKEGDGALSMGIVNALDKDGKNLGQIGYF